jgi:hypothetical protein
MQAGGLSMNMTRAFVNILLAAVFAGGLASLPARAGDCTALVSAIVKLDHTPHRMLSLFNGAGPRGPLPEKKYEEIFTGDMFYSTTDTGWKSKPETGDELAQDFLNARKTNESDCESGGSEAVAGQMTDVIKMHSGSSLPFGGFSLDARIWVSRSSALPVKRELVLSNSGPNGKISMTTTDTFFYDDVHPPAVP